MTAPVIHTSYWSVSAFDANTNNFFVRNDQQTPTESIELIVVKHGQAWPKLDNAVERVILFSPSEKGLILFRAVIDDDKHLPALEAALHQAHCGTVASAPSCAKARSVKARSGRMRGLRFLRRRWRRR